MDLSIIIVSWNVKDRLRTNLQALFTSSGALAKEIFVVDNDSRDGSAEMVKSEFPAVRLIANSTNRGFSKANNQAIKLASGRFILLLNPDMQVWPETLEKILVWAQTHPTATVTGCKLLDGEGRLVPQVRRFPKFLDQLLITLKIPHLWPASIKKYLCLDFDYERAARVDSIRGAFFLINRENYRKISGGEQPFLDEHYFIWFEEVDFCRRVYQQGGEIWYTPTAVCRDYVGQSFAQMKLGETQKYFSDSMLEYFQHWGKRWEYLVLKIVWGLIRIFI